MADKETKNGQGNAMGMEENVLIKGSFDNSDCDSISSVSILTVTNGDNPDNLKKLYTHND